MIVKLLIESGADFTSKNNYAIRYASRNGHIEIVRLLIGLGADFTSKNNYAINYASMNGYTEIVRLLIENGDDHTKILDTEEITEFIVCDI